MVFLPRMSYDPCIGLMIMNTLLALHLNTIGANTGKYIHPLFDLTADILYEFRMVIGVFGDILLVRPLQQSIERRDCSEISTNFSKGINLWVSAVMVTSAL